MSIGAGRVLRICKRLFNPAEPAASPPARPEPPFEYILEKREIDVLLPGIAQAKVTLTVDQIPQRPDMLMPLRETVILGAICRHIEPRNIFEFGTFTGGSSLVMAMNTADDAKIFTLDLEPSATVGSAYQETPYEAKITQLYGDSRSFDFAPFLGRMDLVLVDANHAYEFVKADTANAFALLSGAGIVLWDDYAWDAAYPECAGVAQHLHELVDSRELSVINGTRLAFHAAGQARKI